MAHCDGTEYSVKVVCLFFTLLHEDSRSHISPVCATANFEHYSVLGLSSNIFSSEPIPQAGTNFLTNWANPTHWAEFSPVCGIGPVFATVPVCESYRYNNPSVRYNNPSARYNNTSAQYSNLSAPYSNPSSRYNNPCARYNNPCARYNNPRAHDIIIRAHDIIIRAHDIIIRPPDIVIRALDIVIRALEI